MVEWAEKNKIMWALDPKAKMPADAELAKMPVEDVGADFSKENEEKKRKKRKMAAREFPFMLGLRPLAPLPLIKLQENN